MLLQLSSFITCPILSCSSCLKFLGFTFILLGQASLAVLGGDENHQVFWVVLSFLGSFTTNATSQLDVLGHDSHPLSMDCCQVGILKETHKVSLSRLLKSQDSAGLKPQISLEVLSNLTHQSLKRQLANEQLSWFLILANLTKGDSSWPVPAQVTNHFNYCGIFWW